MTGKIIRYERKKYQQGKEKHYAEKFSFLADNYAYSPLRGLFITMSLRRQ